MLSVVGLVSVVCCTGNESTNNDGGGTTTEPTGNVAGAGGGISAQDRFPKDAPAEQLPRFVHYIRASPFPRLVLEVDYVDGLQPRASVEQRLRARFEAILEKPGGVDIVHDQVLESRGAEFVWTSEALRALAAQVFSDEHGNDTISIHVMVLDGKSERDDESGSILGLAWEHRHIVLFKNTIERACGGLGLIGPLRERACEQAELGIWTHEMGHVLGLVDNGLPMVQDHRDPDRTRGPHDKDPNCIMYWAYEGEGLTDIIASRLKLSGQDELDFCAPSLADIDAAK